MDRHPDPGPEDLELCAQGVLDFAGAKREFNLGRSFLYEQIKSGAIRTIRRGRRRLIPRAELVRLSAQNLEPAQDSVR